MDVGRPVEMAVHQAEQLAGRAILRDLRVHVNMALNVMIEVGEVYRVGRWT